MGNSTIESRALKRDLNNNLLLNGKIVNLKSYKSPQQLNFGKCPPQNFRTKESLDIKMQEVAEEECTKIGADCYELGRRWSTWSSDPGFGAEYINFPVQFYLVVRE